MRRYGAALAAVVVAAGLSGCGAFVAPNSAHAPLKASLAAEALYAGPVKLQPREVARLGTACTQTPDCRLGEAAPRRAATIGTITVLEPSATGTKLRAPWIRWTQLYRGWDAGFSKTYTLDSKESGLLWEEGETERNKGLFQVFRDFGDVTRLELVLDQNRFRYDLSAYGRDVLVGRIRALLKQRTTATADRTDIEQQIRAHLELLAATDQRADARVKRLESIAREEADLYAAFTESIRTLDGLQRNITNHLIGQDLVLSAEEARALADAIQERFKRIREAIEAGRKAGVEEAAQAKPPEWADRVRSLLDELRPKRKE